MPRQKQWNVVGTTTEENSAETASEEVDPYTVFKYSLSNTHNAFLLPARKHFISLIFRAHVHANGQ